MSEPHLDFSLDHLPTDELHNQNASTDFDWSELFRNCDGELASLEHDLGAEDFQKLQEALVGIFAYAIGGTRDNMGNGLDRAAGRRLLYLASVLCPRIIGMNRTDLTREIGITKQAVSDGIKDAKKFLRTLRV